MAASENQNRNIFVILEDFLIKVASLDAFEILIFNYKLKSELLDDLPCNLIPIIGELLNEVQELLNEYKSKSHSQCENSNDLYLFTSLDEHFESDNVPGNEKINKSNSNDNEDGQTVDLISTSVLREIPLFSPKCIIEDNIGVDSPESLWNSDSKCSDMLPNQIHIPDISEHSTASDTYNSIQCSSCHRLFSSDFKLASHICKHNKEKSNGCKTKTGNEFSEKLSSTKVNQEFPLDFRHSTEIRSLIEDALQIPKEDYVIDNHNLNYKLANDHCTVVEIPQLEDTLLKENNECHSEKKVILELDKDISKEQELEDYISRSVEEDKSIKGSNNPSKSEVAVSKPVNRAGKSRKRTGDVFGDRSKSEKSEEALNNGVSKKQICRNEEEFTESALINSVIVNSKNYEIVNGGEEKHTQGKVKVTKRKNKKKDKEDVLKKGDTKKIEETHCKENRNENEAKCESKDSWESGEIKCAGSSFTSFICCSECFHVHKDWESFDSHICCASSMNKEVLKDTDEDADDVSIESQTNKKKNDENNSDKEEKEMSAVENSTEESKSNDAEITDHIKMNKTSKNVSVEEVQGKRKRSSVITDHETLRGIHRFVCSICLEEYRSLNRMMYHLPRCVTGPYKCELCPLEYVSRRELNLHKKKNHRDAQSFICDECGVKFKFRTSLQKHKVNRHERWTEKETYSCTHCTLTFPKKIYLTNHCIKVHRLERKFLCQICGKKFLNQNSLNSHLNYHTDEAKSRFPCSHCSKTFLRKEKLQYHLRIHTGERPFVCKSCGKTFISKAKLKEHLWRHGGNKRYSCPLCPKKYAGRWDLKLHVRKMHGRNLNSTDGHLLESGDVPESSNPSTSENEKVRTSPTSIHDLDTVNINETCPSEILVMGEVQNDVTGSNNDGIVVQLASVSNLGQTVLPTGTLLTLANTMDHSLPHSNSQQPQFIQLNSPSASSTVPIHIQVSSATQSFDVSSQPGIIFTSGLYLS